MRRLTQLFSVLALGVCLHCQVLYDYGLLKDPDREDKVDLYTVLVSLGLLQGVGDYMARLYQFNALLAGDSTNKLYVGEALRANVNAGNKKLILVHGWHPDDRDIKFIPYPTIEELKDRVLKENWSDFAATSHYSTILGKGYDVYAFDYLTSQGVDENGRRFRAWLDAMFSGETGTVYIYAHSMGGLVTRFAVYEGEQPAYLARVISTGTPYHGSPWASKQFLSGLSVLGSLAGFITDTTGGQDLRWDNFDSSVVGASNPKLDALNAKTDRDGLFHAMYGSIAAGSTSGDSGADASLLAACGLLTAFGDTDCIVPSSSATLSGHTLASTQDLANYTHNDVKMGNSAIRQALVDKLP